LNLFNFFNLILVSSGTVWKYLTLTGTIRAQSNPGEKGALKKFSFFFYDLHEIIALPIFPFFSSALMICF
jgi:hypothetical protein